MRFISLFLASCFVCLAHAQAHSQLLGKLVKGDDQSRTPVDSVSVSLDEDGSHDVTKDGGLFQLFLPDVLRAGDEVTITVAVPGYAIYEPPGGKLRIPSDADLPPRKRVTIQLLQKGSLKFLSDAQLRAFVERSAKESNRPASNGKSERTARSGPLFKGLGGSVRFQRGSSSYRTRPLGCGCGVPQSERI